MKHKKSGKRMSARDSNIPNSEFKRVFMIVLSRRASAFKWLADFDAGRLPVREIKEAIRDFKRNGKTYSLEEVTTETQKQKTRQKKKKKTR